MSAILLESGSAPLAESGSRPLTQDDDAPPPDPPTPSAAGGSAFDRTATVAAGASTTVARIGSTRLRHVIVTDAGTGTGSVLFYDGTDTSGTVIAAIPGTVSAGAFFRFVVPAMTGLTVLNVVDGPGLTISVD